MFKTACESLKYAQTLEGLLLASGAQAAAQKQQVRKSVLLVMAYELLLGHGKIDGGGAVKRLLKEFELPMRAALSRLKIAQGVETNEELLPLAARSSGGVSFPRYARVNTLRTCIEEVQSALAQQGFVRSSSELALIRCATAE